MEKIIKMCEDNDLIFNLEVERINAITSKLLFAFMPKDRSLRGRAFTMFITNDKINEDELNSRVDEALSYLTDEREVKEQFETNKNSSRQKA